MGRSRLTVALALSCLLHTLVILLPWLGTSGQGEKTAALSFNGGSSLLTAILTTQRDSPSPPIQPETGIAANDDDISQPSGPNTEDVQPKSHTEGVDILPIPGMAYYTTDQLTKRPQAVVIAELDTEATRPIIVSGRMILRLWLDVRGRVVEVVVEQSELPKVFAETAINAFRHSRFTPGELNGQLVGTVMRVEVSYDDKRLNGNGRPSPPTLSVMEN